MNLECVFQIFLSKAFLKEHSPLIWSLALAREQDGSRPSEHKMKLHFRQYYLRKNVYYVKGNIVCIFIVLFLLPISRVWLSKILM